PPTPRMTLFGPMMARQRVHLFLGQELVLNQAATHLFHGDDGRLLGRSGQSRTSATLQLARPLGGDNDKAIDALLRIVRNRAMGIIPYCLFWHRYIPHKIQFQKSPRSAGYATPSGPGASARPARWRPAIRRK